jgi:hypothetical protein
MASSLAIAWFQDTLAPPLDSEVEAKMRELRWDKLAFDWTP